MVEISDRQTREASKRRPGRRAKYDWRTMALCFRELARNQLIDPGMSTSAIADRLLKAFEEDWTELPETRAVEVKVAEWRLILFDAA